MARINLLPWRAELRKQRQKEFNLFLGFSAAIGVLISLVIVMYYNGQIDGQNNRNSYLTQQIAAVEKQLEEIDTLDKKKEGLLNRKRVIEDLQSKRSRMVHLFDELVRTIPEGVMLASIKQNGDVLTLDGRAQSNARVSSYMRSLEKSGWMAGPDLSVIEAKGSDKGLPFEFSLKVNLKAPTKSDTEADAATGGAL